MPNPHNNMKGGTVLLVVLVLASAKSTHKSTELLAPLGPTTTTGVCGVYSHATALSLSVLGGFLGMDRAFLGYYALAAYKFSGAILLTVFGVTASQWVVRANNNNKRLVLAQLDEVPSRWAVLGAGLALLALLAYTGLVFIDVLLIGFNVIPTARGCPLT